MTVSLATRVAVVASPDLCGLLATRLASAPHASLQVVPAASLADVRQMSGTVDAVLYDWDGHDGHDLDLLAFPDVAVPVVVIGRHFPEPVTLGLLHRGVAEVVAWNGIDVEAVAAAVRRAAARAARPAANVVESLPIGVVWKDRNGRIRGANRFVAELAGVGRPSQLLGRRDEDMPWGRHADRHRSDDRLVLATGLPLPPYQERIRLADGRELTLETQKVPLFDDAGDLEGLVVVLRDVTDRGAHEGADPRGAATWTSALERADIPAVVTDREGRIVHASRRWLETTGYAPEDVRGTTPSFLRSGGSAEDHEWMWATMLSGEVWQGRLVNRRADGTEYEADHTIAPLRSGEGTVDGFVSVGVEVGRRPSFHERVAGARRMEALGRLSAGVAHDFNNLLGVVLTSSDLLADALERENVGRELIHDLMGIRAAAESGRDVVSALLAYSRRSRIRPEPTDLAEAVAAHIAMLEEELHDGTTLHLSVGGSVPEVLVDRGALRQILRNLVSNAQEAMPDGGRIRVTVDAVVVDDAFVARRHWANPGLYAEVRVSDDGVGIEPGALDLIFDPFFSTKGTDRGAGLGLSSTFGLMKQHGGYVYAESEPGAGATLHLLLPGSGAGSKARGAEPAGRDADPTRSPERGVLYVEDNDALRRAGCRVLQGAGFQVYPAVNGLEALEVFEAHRDGIHAVVSDLVMPGMGGGELYRALVERYGEIPFVLTTAHIDDNEEGDERVPDHVPYLLKPWAVRDLLDAVNRVLL